MIKAVKLWINNPQDYNGVPIVRIELQYRTNWLVLNLDDLKQILRKWIKGEELKYPQSEGFRGRWLLFDEIKKVFDEEV